MFDVIVAVSNPQGDADHFECDTQDVLSGSNLWPSKNGVMGMGRSRFQAGALPGLSATGASRRAVADDEEAYA